MCQGPVVRAHLVSSKNCKETVSEGEQQQESDTPCCQRGVMGLQVHVWPCTHCRDFGFYLGNPQGL